MIKSKNWFKIWTNFRPRNLKFDNVNFLSPPKKRSYKKFGPAKLLEGWSGSLFQILGLNRVWTVQTGSKRSIFKFPLPPTNLINFLIVEAFDSRLVSNYVTLRWYVPNRFICICKILKSIFTIVRC